MRIVYVNLHNNGFFVRRLRNYLSGQKAITKHAFFLNWLLQNNINVINYITPTCCLLPTKYLRKIENREATKKELAKLVFWMNRIPKKSIMTITDSETLQPDDIIIYYGTFDKTQFDTIDQISGIKIVDHIHFYGNKESAERLRNTGIEYYLYEVDLDKYSRLYQKNYSWFCGKFIERPYAYEDRFKNTKDYKRRKNKAMAIGTLTKCPEGELAETYGEYYQPRRKMILDHADELADILDSYISEYQEEALKIIEKNDYFFKKIYKLIFNFFHSGKQKKYFSFDMVEKFNEYKMFICPEDVNGSYGIGTIEGMACGCAMIGWDYGAFEDMGMIADVHYIAYDGTLESLRAKIEYYQRDDNQAQLEKIARTGCEYVRAHYSQEKVAERYYDDLKKIHDNQMKRSIQE